MDSAINRIRQMEAYFDALSKACAAAPKSLLTDDSLREMLRVLTEYYDGGQWLRDYQADEAGLLPHDLKRGVLSEDGVYNLLCDLAQDGE